MPEKPHVSPSSMNTLHRCGLYWERYYPGGEKPVPPTGIVIGQATHSVQEATLKAKLSGDYYNKEQQKELAVKMLRFQIESKGLRLNKKEKELGLDAVKNEMEQMIIRLAEFHRTNILPLINPIDESCIEKEFNLDIPGYKYILKGYVDVVEEKSLRDLKVLGAKVSDISQSDQYAVYSLWYFSTYKEFPNVIQDSLIKRKISKKNPKGIPEYDPIECRHDENTIQTLLWRLKRFEEVVETGVFKPASTAGWWCGTRDNCAFFDTCPAMYRKQFAVSN